MYLMQRIKQQPVNYDPSKIEFLIYKIKVQKANISFTTYSKTNAPF